MILGTGVDTVSLSRFETKLTETPRLKDRLFLDIETVNDGAEASIQTLAGRFAAKEAVIKAAGMGLSMPLQSFSVHTGPQESGWIASFTANAAQGTTTMLEDCGQWTSLDIRTTEDYQCSVAAHSPCLDVVVCLAF